MHRFVSLGTQICENRVEMQEDILKWAHSSTFLEKQCDPYSLGEFAVAAFFGHEKAKLDERKLRLAVYLHDCGMQVGLCLLTHLIHPFLSIQVYTGNRLTKGECQ